MIYTRPIRIEFNIPSPDDVPPTVAIPIPLPGPRFDAEPVAPESISPDQVLSEQVSPEPPAPASVEFVSSAGQISRVEFLPGATSAIPMQATPDASGEPAGSIEAPRTRLVAASAQGMLASTVVEEAAVLIGASMVHLVVTAAEGPRILAGVPQQSVLWGRETLAALISTDEPLRVVIDGDPLAGGAATALLVLPMWGGGVRVATVLARRSGDQPFTEGDQHLLDQLCQAAGEVLRGSVPPAVPAPGGHQEPSSPASVVANPTPWEAAAQLLDRNALLGELRQRIEHGVSSSSLFVIVVDALARLRTRFGAGPADAAMADVTAALMSGMHPADGLYLWEEHSFAVLVSGGPSRAADIERRLLDAVREALAAHLGAELDRDSTADQQLTAAVVAVADSAESTVLAAEGALAVRRVQARWSGQPHASS